jgi:hypothetical protein
VAKKDYSNGYSQALLGVVSEGWLQDAAFVMVWGSNFIE